MTLFVIALVAVVNNRDAAPLTAVAENTSGSEACPSHLGITNHASEFMQQLLFIDHDLDLNGTGVRPPTGSF